MKACGFVAALAIALASGCSVLPAAGGERGRAALARPIAAAGCGPSFSGLGLDDEYCGQPMLFGFIVGAVAGLPANIAWLPVGLPLGAAADSGLVIGWPVLVTGYVGAFTFGAPVFLLTLPTRMIRAARGAEPSAASRPWTGPAPDPPGRAPHPDCCDHLEIGARLVPHEPRAGLDQALYEALGRPETAAGAEAALRGRPTAIPLLRQSGLADPARAAAARRILGEK